MVRIENISNCYDVSGCEYFDGFCQKYDTACEEICIQKCVYKQLKREEQQCEYYKTRAELQEQIIHDYELYFDVCKTKYDQLLTEKKELEKKLKVEQDEGTEWKKIHSNTLTDIKKIVQGVIGSNTLPEYVVVELNKVLNKIQVWDTNDLEKGINNGK